MTHLPSQMPELKPCPVAEAFRRIASKSRHSMGDAEFDRYKENEQDIITVQHFLLTAGDCAASVPSDKERAEALDEFNSMLDFVYTDTEGEARPIRDWFSDDAVRSIRSSLTAPDQSDTIKTLIQDLKRILVVSEDPRVTHYAVEAITNAQQAIALAEKARGA